MTIKLNLYIFLFVVLFFITSQLDIYALVMIFALIHELGHLICGIALGFEPDILRIMPFGFCVEFKTNVQDYNKKILQSNLLSIKKIMIALTGPIVNILIMIMGIICHWNNHIIYANLLITLFNLLPIYPLDGGRILKNIFKLFSGNRKANTYMNLVSNLFLIILTMLSSIVILVYKNIAIFVIILFLWSLIFKENKRYHTYNKIYKTIDKSQNYL